MHIFLPISSNSIKSVKQNLPDLPSLFCFHFSSPISWRSLLIMSPTERGEGHIVFGADPVGVCISVGVGVGVGVSMTFPCLHDTT